MLELNLNELGWAVTPTKGKRPILNDWCNQAIRDPSQAERWLDKGYNLAVVTGRDSGLVVLDIDPRNGGDEALDMLTQRLGPLPHTVTCDTGGGGVHFYFAHKDDYPRKKTAHSGIDFQSDGRCAILPPSLHPDGGRYDWRHPPWEANVADFPEKWVHALFEREQGNSKILEGTRNNSMFELAANLCKEGKGEAEVHRRTAVGNLTRCFPPLGEEEVNKIVQSAMHRHRRYNSDLRGRQRVSPRQRLPVNTRAGRLSATSTWMMLGR